MKIGIVGAGSIGGTLTRRLTALGHGVFVVNSRGPESLRDLAAETGAKPATVHEAARSGDVTIVRFRERISLNRRLIYSREFLRTLWGNSDRDWSTVRSQRKAISSITCCMPASRDNRPVNNHILWAFPSGFFCWSSRVWRFECRSLSSER
jgi:glycine/D-amino acid oxidase-like deaminating enzyme